MKTRSTIMYVGDSTFIQAAVQDALQDSEVDLLIAPTIHDALLMLPEFQPDAILLNRIVQRTDGLDFLRRMQSSQSLPGTPVIFLTNWDAHVDEALRAGADDYLVIPFSDLQLRHRIEQVLRRELAHETFRDDAEARYVWSLRPSQSSSPMQAL